MRIRECLTRRVAPDRLNALAGPELSERKGGSRRLQFVARGLSSADDRRVPRLAGSLSELIRVSIRVDFLGCDIVY
jgi:hypothetical protein